MTAAIARYRVVHETFYDYQHPISSGRHLAHLTPRDTPWQTSEGHRITITPPPTEQASATDYFGNPVLRFAHDSAHRTLRVRAESEILVRSQAPRWRAGVGWEEAALGVHAASINDPPELAEFRLASPNVPLLDSALDYARYSFPAGRPLVDALRALTARIRAEFVYDPLATTIATPIAEVATRRRGVCQDFAHFMLSGLRGLGLAARYMSGYIVNEAPISKVRGADTSHAWIAVCCPSAESGADWIGCDPTNGKLADLEFVTLGWGRDFGDVTPLRGVVLGAGTHPPKVAVQVTRL